MAFLSGHLGYPFPSPALFDQLGQRFRRAVAAYAQANDLPWLPFAKDDDKLAMMRAHLDRRAATGTSGVAAVGVVQEFQRVWAATQGKTSTGTPRWSFYKANRRVTCSYFYLWDADFGPAFVKVCAWLPYPAKVWLNGHQWPNARPPRLASASPRSPTGLPPARIHRPCRSSATGSVPAPSACSSSAGWLGRDRLGGLIHECAQVACR